MVRTVTPLETYSNCDFPREGVGSGRGWGRGRVEEGVGSGKGGVGEGVGEGVGSAWAPHLPLDTHMHQHINITDEQICKTRIINS